MAYAHTDFSQSRKFGSMTYALLAIASIVLFLIIGLFTSIESAEPSGTPFGGFTMENTSYLKAEK